MAATDKHPILKRVLRLKARLGVTDDALAKLLGVSLRTVRSWKYEGVVPSNLAREKIAQLEKSG